MSDSNMEQNPADDLEAILDEGDVLDDDETAEYHGNEVKTFHETLDALFDKRKIDAQAKKQIEALQRYGYRDVKFANDVLQEAAADAAKKGAPVINDNHRRIAQARLVEEEREHHGTPSKFKRANGEEFCNRSAADLTVEDSDGNEQTFAVFDSILPGIELPRDKEGSLPLTIKPAAVSLYDLEILAMSVESRALLEMLILHADEVRAVEANKKLDKRQRNQKIQGLERKLAFAISQTPFAVQSELQNVLDELTRGDTKRKDIGMELKLFAALSTVAPAVRAEIGGAVELEREAAGIGRLCKNDVNNTANPNSLIRPIDRNLKADDGPYNAFKRWGGQKKKFADEFWADVFAGKLTGPDGFIVWPEPIQPDSAFVSRRYSALNRDLDDYLPFPNRMTDEQRAEDAECWNAYVDAMDADTYCC